MQKIILPVAAALILISCAMTTTNNDSNSTQQTNMTDEAKHTLYDFKAKTIDGTDFDFSTLKGKKVMIVNTASECGYTPQYAALQELYAKYDSTGKFEIIGFPCNQFGGQEPGTSAEIKTFCTQNYGVTFQMMEKIDVKGDNQHPLYKWLTNKSENGVEDASVKWNFNKFLIDENGHYVRHAGSSEEPGSEAIIKWIEGK